MSNSYEKLLLSVELISRSSGKPELNINNFVKNNNHLLTFSCISILSSQLTVLTSCRPKELCQRVLDFIENPRKRYKSIKYVSGFTLEIFERINETYFNQFYPRFNPNVNLYNNNAVEADIVQILMNYITYVFYSSSSVEQDKVRTFLLVSISFFQQELLPIVKQTGIFDLKERTMLAADRDKFISSIYHMWDSVPFSPKSKLFNQNLRKANSFNRY